MTKKSRLSHQFVSNSVRLEVPRVISRFPLSASGRPILGASFSPTNRIRPYLNSKNPRNIVRNFMSKRFTSTEKWGDPWFCSLKNDEKLFWMYLIDSCNHAGIWQVNWPLVLFHIKGFNFDVEIFKDRIIQISEDKWFIKKFIQFQYGELNPA